MEMLVKPIELKNLNSDDNPFQSEFWAVVKALNKWNSYGFSLYPETDEEEKTVSKQTILVLVKKISGPYSLAYIPFAPIDENSKIRSEVLISIATDVIANIEERVFAVRFDLPWGHIVTVSDAPYTTNRIKHLSYAIQPEHTSVIDLKSSIDEIYNSFRKRAKRNIKKCRELVIKKVRMPEDVDLFDEWYKTYIVTAERDGFQPRSAEYIINLLHTGSTSVQTHVAATLSLAMHNSEIKAGIITVQTKTRSVFLIGSSLREADMNFSPSYLLQWNAIQYAKESGCLTYDLFGVPPDGDENHYLSGLHSFKSAFGGRYISRQGTWDIPLKRLPYYLFSIIEKIRIKKARTQ
jgi:lipid II:glycine glycyltransferase (peptidoglycan interpeptide bridge formation enzyme)